MLHKKSYIAGLFALLFLFSSCGPINYFTRLKKTPREYSMNYCGEPVLAPRNEFSQESWIVFSDRDDNISYRNPGGKVKFKEIDFLQPFFVIKEKGDYLCLVKYDPAIVEDNIFQGKIKDRKKAQYYGWMHKSRLLLTKQSVTDIATGFKNKQVSIITDTTSMLEPQLYFINDSVRVFKNPNLSVNNGYIPLYEILYTLKLSQDREKVLIARKTILSPDSVSTDVLGWIHTSLVQDIGQLLHVDIKSVTPTDSLLFKDKIHCDTLSVAGNTIDESLSFSTHNNAALKYSPVISYKHSDSAVRFKTGIPLPVIDQNDNYVYNVNGNKIKYSRFKELEKELRNLNIIFVIEGQEQVFSNYPSIVSAIQNLQSLFEGVDDTFAYKFGTVMAYAKSTSPNQPIINALDLTDNYSEMMDHLIVMADSLKSFQPIPVQNAWTGLRKAVNMVEPYRKETNLLVIIGETGQQSEWADSTLVRRIANANCRILGYQMYNAPQNTSNNFALQIENMIDVYARWESIAKREKIVYIDQLRQRNPYRESVKNVYTLDFPERSMLQGWVLFPEKNVDLPLEIFTNSVDTLIEQVKWDNNNIVNSLYKAFSTIGNHLFKYDSVFVDYNKWGDSIHPIKKDIVKLFHKQLPEWYLPSEKIEFPDSVNSELDYHLLLSKDELAKLVRFMQDLSANEVDYKYEGGKKQKAKKICNCPEDDPYADIQQILTDKSGNPKYINTRNIRKKLQQAYVDELNTCKQCKIGKLKSLSLAEAQRIITGCPTFNPDLEKYTLKVLKKKKNISDADLDKLITYFKQKRDELEKYLMDPDKFESNGQTYFWISNQLLP